jgi:acetyl-CoA carboxylase biotin carboxyl carrier protein
MDVDEIVPLGQLRAWLEVLVEAAWQSTGYRRTKNPRIWSIHDLTVLSGHQVPLAPAPDAVGGEGDLGAPSVGLWSPAVQVGAPVGPGDLLGHLRRYDDRIPVRVPAGALGVVTVAHPARTVAYGDPLVTLGEGVDGPQLATHHGVGGGAAADADGVRVAAETDGTAWRRAAPGEPPFVDVGQAVSAGQTLALVEVMKTFTSVRAPFAGVIARAAVQDGQAVEAGATLFWIRPA